jgi:ABC-2 type transport system ATP-binding protein
MRGLLKEYAERGGTVLLSSHLLHEVEAIADEMILIGHGRIVAQGDRRTLLAGARTTATLVAALDDTELAGALTAADLAFVPAGDGFRVEAEPVRVSAAAAARGVVLTDLRPADGALEDLFLELTSKTQRDSVPTPSTSADSPAITQGAEA